MVTMGTNTVPIPESEHRGLSRPDRDKTAGLARTFKPLFVHFCWVLLKGLFFTSRQMLTTRGETSKNQQQINVSANQYY